MKISESEKTEKDVHDALRKNIFSRCVLGTATYLLCVDGIAKIEQATAEVGLKHPTLVHLHRVSAHTDNTNMYNGGLKPAVFLRAN